MNGIKANLKYLRISPRKVRLIANLIKGRSVKEALIRLKFIDKKSSPIISKFIRSAYSNAKDRLKKEISDENLYIKKISVDRGPTLKRYMPRARGSAYMIRKRTSHIIVVLEERQKHETQGTKSKK